MHGFRNGFTDTAKVDLKVFKRFVACVRNYVIQALQCFCIILTCSDFFKICKVELTFFFIVPISYASVFFLCKHESPIC